MRQTTQDIVLARLRELGRRWGTDTSSGESHQAGGPVERRPVGESVSESGAERPAAQTTVNPSSAADQRAGALAHGDPEAASLVDPEAASLVDLEAASGGGSDRRVDAIAEPREGTPWGRLLALLAVVAITVAGLAAFLAWPRSVPEPSSGPADAVAPVGEPGDVTSTAKPAGQGGTDPFAEPSQTPTSSIVVHVAGDVRHPGVVRLPTGSRVIDAVEAAGGLARGGVWGQVNLARILSDGERVEVGSDAPVEGSGAGEAGTSAPGAADPSALVDLNSATADQLDALPGVGPVTATKILAWRSEHGRFTVVDELAEVSGIGPKTLEEIRPHVRV